MNWCLPSRYPRLVLVLGQCLCFSAGCGESASDASIEVGAGGQGDAGGGAGGAGEAGAPGGSGACEVPDAQLFSVIHAGATLRFSTSEGAAIELGTSSDPSATAPAEWVSADELTLEGAGAPYVIKVFAQSFGACAGERKIFEQVYEVRERYDGPAGPDSPAIAKSDAAIVLWATGYVEPVAYGTDVDEIYQTPDKALGAAVGDALDVASLGNAGEFTLTFAPTIQNGEGADFVVFENGFGDSFLELAFVEVSSNGRDFVRFDTAYLWPTKLGAFDMHEPEGMAGFAGKHRQGFGTPFDLELLRYRPLVQRGLVELSAISHVRLVDIVGDGATLDSFGAPIYDPTPTQSSAGFDVDAVGVLNAND